MFWPLGRFVLCLAAWPFGATRPMGHFGPWSIGRLAVLAAWPLGCCGRLAVLAAWPFCHLAILTAWPLGSLFDLLAVWTLGRLAVLAAWPFCSLFGRLAILAALPVDVIGRSFHIGAATTAAQVGLEDIAIKMLGH